MFEPGLIERSKSLRLLTTLKAGGSAESFWTAHDIDDFAAASIWAQTEGVKTTILGSGSNILPSDQGVAGLTLHNLSDKIAVSPGGEIVADCGCSFQELFLKTAQASLAGLEFAVGIPGSLGGALVSNAGAYRSNISEFLTEIEIVEGGARKWVAPSFMNFSYRDSLLRSVNPPPVTLLRVKMRMPMGEPKAIYDEAREYQRQRISKQPPSASAGSFFKNVYDQALADSLDNLPERLREAGVVPAGYLIENCGLKGARYKGAMIGDRHANFLLNVGGASATSLRRLAEYVSAQVRDRFGVSLEEEVLYLGDWADWVPTTELALDSRH